MTNRVALLLFSNGNFNLVSGDGSRHEENFTAHTADAGRAVGQTVDGHNMSARGRHEEKKAKIKRQKLKI
jgi:hypothetical protein